MEFEGTVTAEEAGQRLDVWCVEHTSGISRGAVQKAIKGGLVLVNGTATTKPRYVVKVGEVVAFSLPGDVAAPAAIEVAPVPLPIIYEDKDVVVVDKPAGIAVHPGTGQESYTVAHWFAKRYPESLNIGAPLRSESYAGQDAFWRPGIVHRLDKDTSGVLILAKTRDSYEHLKQQFSRRRAHKEYLALVFGIPGEAKGRINRALARSKRNPLRRTIVKEWDPTSLTELRGAPKEAITEWRTEEKLADRYALLRLFPLTGRTHQIRAHLHWLGFPIVGDALYVFKRQKPPAGVKRQLLHAAKLTLTMLTGKRRSFSAPLPEDFEAVLSSLR